MLTPETYENLKNPTLIGELEWKGFSQKINFSDITDDQKITIVTSIFETVSSKKGTDSFSSFKENVLPLANSLLTTLNHHDQDTLLANIDPLIFDDVEDLRTSFEETFGKFGNQEQQRAIARRIFDKSFSPIPLKMQSSDIQNIPVLRTGIYQNRISASNAHLSELHTHVNEAGDFTASTERLAWLANEFLQVLENNGDLFSNHTELTDWKNSATIGLANLTANSSVPSHTLLSVSDKLFAMAHASDTPQSLLPHVVVGLVGLLRNPNIGDNDRLQQTTKNALLSLPLDIRFSEDVISAHIEGLAKICSQDPLETQSISDKLLRWVEDAPIPEKAVHSFFSLLAQCAGNRESDTIHLDTMWQWGMRVKEALRHAPPEEASAIAEFTNVVLASVVGNEKFAPARLPEAVNHFSSITESGASSRRSVATATMGLAHAIFKPHCDIDSLETATKRLPTMIPAADFSGDIRAFVAHALGSLPKHRNCDSALLGNIADGLGALACSNAETNAHVLEGLKNLAEAPQSGSAVGKKSLQILQSILEKHDNVACNFENLPPFTRPVDIDTIIKDNGYLLSFKRLPDDPLRKAMIMKQDGTPLHKIWDIAGTPNDHVSAFLSYILMPRTLADAVLRTAAALSRRPEIDSPFSQANKKIRQALNEPEKADPTGVYQALEIIKEMRWEPTVENVLTDTQPLVEENSMQRPMPSSSSSKSHQPSFGK